MVISLSRDYVPSSWGLYSGTIWDWMTYIGTIGLFLALLFLFLRFLPAISIFEMRTLLPEARVQEAGHEGPTDAAQHPGPCRAGRQVDQGGDDVKPFLYGMLAEFDNPTELVAAVHKAREAGYRRMEAYTPFPVEEVVEALHQPPTVLPWLVFMGGLAGCIGGFFMQWYAAVVSYPVVVGGKPTFSWPMFIPITFELTILCASLTAVLGMLALNGLPMPYHPLFNVPRFAQAHARPLFPVRPVARSAVRRGAGEATARRAEQASGDGGAAMNRMRTVRLTSASASERSAEALARARGWYTFRRRVLSCWRPPAAGRRWPRSRATRRCSRASFSATTAPPGRWSRAWSRAAGPAKTFCPPPTPAPRPNRVGSRP